MKVILLKSVPKVGHKDTIVDVADGYAAHALFPKKLAIPATESAVAALRRRKDGEVAERAMQHQLLDKAIETINQMNVSMHVKANEQGHLFAKLHAGDIAAFLAKEHRISIDSSLMRIKGDFIKTIGEYPVEVVDGTYKATFTISIDK